MPGVPSTQPKPMKWEWLAGFFDGEGCIVVRIDTKKKRKSPDIWLQFHQLPRSGVLLEIREFLEQRAVSVHYHVGQKGCGMLQISKKADVELCLKRMFPYLRVKRGQAEECLRYFSELRILQKEFGMRYYMYGVERPEIPTRARQVI